LARSTNAFQRQKTRVHALSLNASLRHGDEVAMEMRLVMRWRISAMSFSMESLEIFMGVRFLELQSEERERDRMTKLKVP
jgi:hypothetical protein